MTAATNGSMFLIIGVIWLISLLLFVIPAIIIFWKLFAKAGQPGWAAIIPYYNTYVMGIVAKKPTIAIIVIIASIASNFSRASDSPIVGSITGIGLLVWLVLSLIILSKFIQQYDAGIGKWFLFLFFPIIGVFFVEKTNYKGSNPIVASTGSATQPIDHTAPLPSAYGASRYSSLDAPTAPETPTATQRQQIPVQQPQESPAEKNNLIQ